MRPKGESAAPMSGEQTEHLIKMLRQIVLNLSAIHDDEEAAKRACEHIKKFWAPTMKQHLVAYAQAHSKTLSPVAHKTIDLLIRQQPAVAITAH